MISLASKGAIAACLLVPHEKIRARCGPSVACVQSARFNGSEHRQKYRASAVLNEVIRVLFVRVLFAAGDATTQTWLVGLIYLRPNNIWYCTQVNIGIDFGISESYCNSLGAVHWVLDQSQWPRNTRVSSHHGAIVDRTGRRTQLDRVYMHATIFTGSACSISETTAATRQNLPLLLSRTHQVHPICSGGDMRLSTL